MTGPLGEKALAQLDAIQAKLDQLLARPASFPSSPSTAAEDPTIADVLAAVSEVRDLVRHPVQSGIDPSPIARPIMQWHINTAVGVDGGKQIHPNTEHQGFIPAPGDEYRLHELLAQKNGLPSARPEDRLYRVTNRRFGTTSDAMHAFTARIFLSKAEE